MYEELKILFAEDYDPDYELAVREIEEAGIRFQRYRVWSENEFRKALVQFKPTIVVSDYSMPAFTGMQALQIALEFDPLIPFVVLTGSINEETAVKCLKAGAADYVLKERIKRLPYAVKDALAKRQNQFEKKEALDRLKESENLLRQAQKIASIGSWEFDLSTGLVHASDEARRIYGMGQEQKTISEVQAMVLEQYRPMLDKSMKEHMESGSPYEVEFQIIRGSDQEIRYIQSIAQYAARKNKITGIVRDVTERKVNEHLKQEMLLAKEAANFKQTFLAHISHELRTPLTAVGGIVELLQMTSLDVTQKDYLETLRFSVDNLRNIINEVLDYSRIEAGIVKLNLTSFPSAELFGMSEKIFRSICKKPLSFKVLGQQNIPSHICADRQKIMQVITNLISNAVKYTNQGVVTLEARLEENESGKPFIKLLLHDQGKAINPELKEKLFKPFSQIHDNSELQIEGTGLGLSISKEMVNLMNGEIGVDSEKGKGSTFWFTFPLIEAHMQKTPQPESNPSTNVNNLRGLKILLAEDKLVNQKVISLILNSMGHRVSTAANGLEAFDMCMKENYDLVLMDVQMPVMDGIQATRKLKKECPKKVPIVGLSANALEGDREKYINLGMDDYLTKPVRGKDFTALIKRLNLLQ